MEFLPKWKLQNEALEARPSNTGKHTTTTQGLFQEGKSASHRKVGLKVIYHTAAQLDPRSTWKAPGTSGHPPPAQAGR